MRLIQTVVVIVGIALAITTILAHQKALEAANWKATHAHLIYAYSQNLSSPTKAGANDWGRQKALVKYRYSVNNHSYTGHRLMPLDYIYFPEDRLNTLKKRDGPIEVYFNPKSPSESFIYIDYPFTPMIFLVASSTFFILLGFFGKTIKKKLLKILHETNF